MQLLNSKNSPYGRKVLIIAHALGLYDKITEITTDPRADDAALRPKNPLGKIPTLITDEGNVIADSFAIILHLQQLAGSTDFFANSSPAQATMMFYHAIADGICNGTVLMVQNGRRHDENPAVPLDDAWIKRQETAVNHGIAFMGEALKTKPEIIGTDINIATASLVTSLDYLDFRFPKWGWQDGHKDLQSWLTMMHKNPSVAKTPMPAE